VAPYAPSQNPKFYESDPLNGFATFKRHQPYSGEFTHRELFQLQENVSQPEYQQTIT
jgi:hypothetical protein